jgi:serine/threonine protein kinase
MVSHYRIIEKIGAGGMGEVYLAVDTKLNRQVALKFLPTNQADDSDTRTRFTREAQSVAKLNHPNIITVYEVGEFSGRPFFAMEYVTGKSLSHYCRNGKLSLAEIIALAIQVCDGLSKAHQIGIVHRDIKPANVVIDSDSRAKILDFGLAAVQGAETITKTGSTLGTIAYMSPEQAQGKELDQRSDLFSFGVVLYELITGQSLFKRENDPATLHAIVNDTPEPLARYRSNVPEELQRIVSKLLERDPGLRYQTAPDVVADLKQLSASSMSQKSSPVQANRLRTWGLTAVIGVVVLISTVTLLWRSNKVNDYTASTINISTITNDGRVTSGAISPDGGYVAFARADAGIYSVWMQHLTTGSRVEIVPSSRLPLKDVCFSLDGSFVYYRQVIAGDLGNLFRVPVLGGKQEQIDSSVWSRVSFSPDGNRMIFFRFSPKTGNSFFIIARANGTEEKELLSQPSARDNFFGTPSWSCDGKLIAVNKDIVGQQPQTVLAILDANTGRQLGQISGDWNIINSVCWLPSGDLIIAAGIRSNPGGSQIWRASYLDNKLRKITNDINNYAEVSVTSDGQRLVVLQVDTRSEVWLSSVITANNTRRILQDKFDGVGGLDWIDNQSLLYFTRVGSDYCFSRFSLVDSTREVVIRGNPFVIQPSVAREGHLLAYTSLSGNMAEIWVCDLSGRNAKRLSDSAWCAWPDISTDGDWLVYCSEGGALSRVVRSNLNGDKVQIVSDTTYPSFESRISPDERWIAYYMYNEPRGKVEIIITPSDGRAPNRVIDVPQTPDAGFSTLRWTPDGSSILFQLMQDGASNVWEQPLDGRVARQVTTFPDMDINDFSMSPDGKTLAICRSKSTSDVVFIEGFR